MEYPVSDGEGQGAEEEEEEEDFLVGPPPPEVAEELDAGEGQVLHGAVLHPAANQDVARPSMAVCSTQPAPAHAGALLWMLRRQPAFCADLLWPWHTPLTALQPPWMNGQLRWRASCGCWLRMLPNWPRRRQQRRQSGHQTPMMCWVWSTMHRQVGSWRRAQLAHFAQL